MLSFESFRFSGRISSSPGKRPGDSPVTPSPKRAAKWGGRAEVVVAAKEDPSADAPPLEVRREAVVAPAPAHWRERYAPVCAACEAATMVVGFLTSRKPDGEEGGAGAGAEADGKRVKGVVVEFTDEDSGKVVR